jgi:hypothetical protein
MIEDAVCDNCRTLCDRDFEVEVVLLSILFVERTRSLTSGWFLLATAPQNDSLVRITKAVQIFHLALLYFLPHFCLWLLKFSLFTPLQFKIQYHAHIIHLSWATWNGHMTSLSDLKSRLAESAFRHMAGLVSNYFPAVNLYMYYFNIYTKACMPVIALPRMRARE